MNNLSINFILIIFYGILLISNNAFGFQSNISEKYSTIFSSKVLGEKDLEYYQKAYQFQVKLFQ